MTTQSEDILIQQYYLFARYININYELTMNPFERTLKGEVFDLVEIMEIYCKENNLYLSYEEYLDYFKFSFYILRNYSSSNTNRYMELNNYWTQKHIHINNVFELFKNHKEEIFIWIR